MTLSIRQAMRADVPVILNFIRELAVYEKAGHEVEATEATEASLEEALFGPDSVTKAAICERDGVAAGFACWFLSFSTWQARNGLYLEDLYVTTEHRGSGAGKALLRHLAKIAIDTGCGRFEWSVLDWNEPAIRIYEAIGAEPMSEWTRYRLSGQALATFAAG
ncbi:GNAT superfamily N-acetyltransferase [Pararhizobium capsulatum DSM 1112]|uniref:GNAT superfamily N-acetyltransferase n=1 Tax=Pararhizobium capsulatum DSM 1112 TaxID=1121113 RepID=A0ABU0BM50_9HYPH|nr:GNAT family N-acetyltransferase [Pararhizobium capsulatum]MDQ0319317.1 GNAT superfamily N-acetyltransferase [Pararhizobium capsulatum DSM 1112]